MHNFIVTAKCNNVYSTNDILLFFCHKNSLCIIVYYYMKSKIRTKLHEKLIKSSKFITGWKY